MPFYLRGLWGSSFSRADNFYKRMTKRQGKREILVAFGPVVDASVDAATMKQKVVELSFSAWERFINRQKPLQHHLLDQAKSQLLKSCVAGTRHGTKSPEIYYWCIGICKKTQKRVEK